MQRHKLDILSLFAGLVFVAIAVVALTDSLVLSIGDLRWLGPLAVVGFGVVLVATAGGRRSRDPEAEDEARHDDEARSEDEAQREDELQLGSQDG